MKINLLIFLVFFSASFYEAMAAASMVPHMLGIGSLGWVWLPVLGGSVGAAGSDEWASIENSFAGK